VQRILVIIQEQAIVSLLASKFKREGLDVLSAPTVQAGLELAEGSFPDLIILDARMEDAEGVSVKQRLRENPATDRIPLILLSARDALEGGEEELQETVDAIPVIHLRKPFRPSQLMALVRSHL
jgi:DNA-binding response OmpR family regulator